MKQSRVSEGKREVVASPGKAAEAGQGKAAVFNSAFALLERLNQLFMDCNQLSRTGDFVSWKRALDVVYRETAFLMGKEELQAKAGLIQLRVLPALKQLQQVQQRKGPDGKQISSKNLTEASDHAYTVLCEYEIWLRDVQGQHGLIMPSPDDPRFAFRQGGN